MKTVGIKRSAVAVAALAMSLLLTQAEASRMAHVRDAQSVMIDATGLDLSSPSGARHLYRRVADAAIAVCRGKSGTYKGVVKAKHERDHVQPCVRTAIDGALAQVAEATGRDLEQIAGRDGFQEGLATVR